MGVAFRSSNSELPEFFNLTRQFNSSQNKMEVDKDEEMPSSSCRGKRKDLKSKSGMPSLFGLGTSWSTIALFAATTSWIFALNAKLIRLQSPLRSAQWLGECVTMLFTSIASLAG